MLGTQWTGRRTREAERLAEDAWENLVSAMESAGHTARTVKRRTADLADEVQSRARSAADDAQDKARNAADRAQGRARSAADRAQDKVSTAADEAWRRATAAVDALAGRRAPIPWGWIAGAAVAGAVIGWVSAAAVRRALAAASDDDLLILDPTGPDPVTERLD